MEPFQFGCILFQVICLCLHSIYGQNCRAVDSYVQITVPSIGYDVTALSAQAMFKPWLYHTVPTDLVVLSSEDDICSGDSLSIDITDKIVLINPVNGDCANVTKVYKAQLNGAKAVLISDTETEIGTVSNLANDDDSTSTQLLIPARTIPYTLALTLATFGDTVFVEFGCRSASSNITSVICMFDESGQHWELEGDYQLQSSLSYNGKPVWLKQGYHLVLDIDYFIFLNNQNYWTISSNSNLSNSQYFVSQCGIENI